MFAKQIEKRFNGNVVCCRRGTEKKEGKKKRENIYNIEKRVGV